jgi:hypothetical protein
LDALQEDVPSSIQQYNDATDALVRQYWDWLIAAGLQEPAAAIFRQLRALRPLSVYACEEHPSEQEMILLPI